MPISSVPPREPARFRVVDSSRPVADVRAQLSAVLDAL